MPLAVEANADRGEHETQRHTYHPKSREGAREGVRRPGVTSPYSLQQKRTVYFRSSFFTIMYD